MKVQCGKGQLEYSKLKIWYFTKKLTISSIFLAQLLFNSFMKLSIFYVSSLLKTLNLLHNGHPHKMILLPTSLRKLKLLKEIFHRFMLHILPTSAYSFLAFQTWFNS